MINPIIQNFELSQVLCLLLQTNQTEAFLTFIRHRNIPPNFYDEPTGFNLCNMVIKMGQPECLARFAEEFGLEDQGSSTCLPLALSAAFYDRPDMLEVLYRKKPSLLKECYQNKDLLYYCHASPGCFELFNQKLKKDYQFGPNSIESARMFACRNDVEMLSVLLENINTEFLQYLVLSVIENRATITDICFDYIINSFGIDKRLKDRSTLLHHALKHQQTRVIQLWLDGKYPLNIKTKSDELPLDWLFSLRQISNDSKEFEKGVRDLVDSGAKASVVVLRQNLGTRSMNVGFNRIRAMLLKEIYAVNTLFVRQYTKSTFKRIPWGLIRVILEEYVQDDW